MKQIRGLLHRSRQTLMGRGNENRWQVAHSQQQRQQQGQFLSVASSSSTFIMDQQLSQLSPQQRQQVLARAQQEANQQIMQDMIQRMVKTCFNKCAGTSVCLFRSFVTLLGDTDPLHKVFSPPIGRPTRQPRTILHGIVPRPVF
jgi:hypothetical protein